MSDQPLVALISATPTAIEPATQGFADEFPDATLWNILDDQLLPAANDAGGVTPPLEARMQRLITHALAENADAVLLTCSMYGAVATNFVSAQPVLAPDEAAFTDIVRGDYGSVLVVASLESAKTDTQARLQAVLTEHSSATKVRSITVPEAFEAAKDGDTNRLASAIVDAVAPMATDVDAIFLAQYSLTPARASITGATGKPVVAGPPSAAAYLQRTLTQQTDTATTERAANSARNTLGVIADDVTGAMDVAAALSESSLTTAIVFGTPADIDDLPARDAIVIAQKIRSLPAPTAIDVAMESLHELQTAGVTQVFYKYCSTFDSTPSGNIGPVVDALADAMGAATVVTTPSSPEHGRTVYQGQLFVNGVLLENTHMARHPVTPMTKSDLPALLRPQTPHDVGAVPWQAVHDGAQALSAALTRQQRQGVRHIVVDAITDDDLRVIAQATMDQPVLAGAAGLARAWGTVRTGLDPVSAQAATSQRTQPTTEPPHTGPTAILAGSCSARTLEQIRYFETRGGRSHWLDAGSTDTARALADKALSWFDAVPANEPALIYSSLEPEALAQVQDRLGAAESAALFETALGLIAEGLVARGVTRLIVAGGETSGAVVAALDVHSGMIGELVAPGVPWIRTLGQHHLSLLLKSGNFGDVELFARVTDLHAHGRPL